MRVSSIRISIVLLSICAFLGLIRPAWADNILRIGDRAPKVIVGNFLKGRPIKELEKGKIYVIEFWATWCVPCKTAIPHLTQIQKRYKNVTVIAVSVYEADPKAVRAFVESGNTRMDYAVATDVVSPNEKPADGIMARTWLYAAALDSIPAAFVIDKDGKVAWIGDPDKIDGPLEEIVNGTWDLQAAAKAFHIEQSAALRRRELEKKLEVARKSGNPRNQISVLDECLKADPTLEELYGPYKLLLLLEQDPLTAVEYCRHLVKSLQNAQSLNLVAWRIVDPARKQTDPVMLKLALDAAQRAVGLTKGRDAAMLDTLAATFAALGDFSKALRAEEQAFVIAKGTELVTETGMNERLKEYRAIVNKRKRQSD